MCHILTGKAIPQPIRVHILIETVLHAIIPSKIYKVPLPFKGKENEENKEQIREKAFEYSVYNEDFTEKTEISSNPTNAVSTSGYDEEIVTAELVLNSLPSGDMELQERQIPDKSSELNIKTSDGFGRDRQSSLYQ